MSAFINSLTLSTVNNAAHSFELQVVCVITLSIFLIQKLLSASAANKSRFAYILNFAINVPLVAFLMVFSVIALVRILLIIHQ